MSDGNLDQIEKTSVMINSIELSESPIALVNDVGKVLFANTQCEAQLDISAGQNITFNLERSGIHKSAEAPKYRTKRSRSSRIQPSLEMEYAGEHCFLLILSAKKTDHPPFLDQFDNEMNALYEKIPGALYRSLDDELHTITQITGGIHALIGFLPEDLVENKKISYLALVHPEDLEVVQIRIG